MVIDPNSYHMTTLFIVLFLVYVASFAYNYWWVCVAYSSKGRFNLIYPGTADLLFTVLPIANTVFALMFNMVSPYKDSHKNHRFFKWFFNINKS